MNKNITGGDARACLKDFFERFGKSEEFMEFVQVKETAERDWRNKGIMPSGTHLIRICCFFEAIGYKMDELQALPEELAAVVRCVSYGIITMEDMGKDLGMHPARLYDYFNQRNQMRLERLSAFGAMAKRFETQLAVKRAECAEKYVAMRASIIGQSSDELVNKFRDVCTALRELGEQLLAAPRPVRFEMRNRMCVGADPELQATWKVLNALLNERKEV